MPACSPAARATDLEMVYVLRMMKPVPHFALAWAPLAWILACSGSPASSDAPNGGSGGTGGTAVNPTGGSGNSSVGGSGGGTGGSGTGGAGVTGGSGGTGASGGTGTSGGAGSGVGGGTGGSGMSGAGGGAGTTSGHAGMSGMSGSAGTSGGMGGSAGAATGGSLPPLHVDGPAIKDPNGKTIVLRGFDLPDIGTLYANANSNASGITARIDTTLAAGLTAHVIRLPVYPRTVANGGSPSYSPAPYPLGATATVGMHQTLTEDDYVSKILKPAVDYTAQKGVYAIIDYHQIDDATGQSGMDAVTFWQKIAPIFASDNHVIFEPFNEPINTTTPWSTFKTTVQSFIDAIRAAAPNNIIIVPSMLWDQRPGDAASDPPTGSNFVYTAHVYPGNWSTSFQQQVATAAAAAPVFFSEWGYVQDGPDKNLGTADANWGPNFQLIVDANGASWSAWVADGSWSPPLFGDKMLGSLSAYGMFTATWLQSKATNDWVF